MKIYKEIIFSKHHNKDVISSLQDYITWLHIYFNIYIQAAKMCFCTWMQIPYVQSQIHAKHPDKETSNQDESVLCGGHNIVLIKWNSEKPGFFLCDTKSL